MPDVYDPTFWCKYNLCPECTEILLDGRRIRPGQKLPRDMRQCLRAMPAHFVELYGTAFWTCTRNSVQWLDPDGSYLAAKYPGLECNNCYNTPQEGETRWIGCCRTSISRNV